MELFTLTLSDLDEKAYSVRLLKEFKFLEPEFSLGRIAALWDRSRKFDVLFSDFTQGDPEVFVSLIADPSSVWFEIESENNPVGSLYLSRVHPNFDAWGHFTFWDSKASGREPIIWKAMEFVFDRYNLRRISAEVPVYQKGVIRFVERLGFVEEGERREGVIHKGEWLPLKMFGLLKSELEEITNE